VLSVLSILIMPTLAYLKGRTGREMGSRALVADSVETWVCAYLSVALLAAVGLNAAFGWWWADPPWGTSDAAGDRLAGVGDTWRSSRRGR
jgi:divalent metal cation (Fe/Co/Zn/Cd) transporter